MNYCNICKLKSDFADYLSGRPNSICRFCGSIERTRAIWQYLTIKIKNAFTKSVLHIAPDTTLHAALKLRCENNYTTCDIEKRKSVYTQCDIQHTDFPDKQFDIIICAHVLEHVKDDKQAIKEMRRIKKPNGLILVSVPLGRQSGTLEYNWVKTDAQRLKYYGQDDHVRLYGWNFGDILGKHVVYTYHNEKVYIIK